MQRYDSYKDSGIQWLGEIPSHWEIVPLYSVASYNDESWDESTPQETIINYVEISDVSLENGIKNVSQVEFGSAPSRARRKTRIGDIIISTVRTYLRAVAPITADGITVSTGFAVLRPQKVNSKYLMYYTVSSGFIADVIGNSKGTSYPAINASELVHLKIAFPPLPEQQAIASYLDTATAKIDEAIAQQQKMIDLLNERKQIIINNAVTKGLNPNAKMKPSGIDWIGNIPEHWEIFKTLYALSMPITDGPHETPRLLESGIPFISAEAVSGGIIDFSHMRGYVSEAFYKECCKKYIPQLHDVYMIKSGATTGRTAIVETEDIFTIWSPLAVFRANKKVINPYFLLNALRATYYTKQVELNWSYGTQQNIGMRILEKLLLCVPPLSEQLAIMKYIDSSIIPINKAIECAEGQISLLQERKQIIINEVVTGKVKVS